MSSIKIRKILVLMHLTSAAFIAPVFFILALSGGLYLLDEKGSTNKTAIELPANSQLNAKSDTLKSDVKQLLKQAGVELSFEYIKVRGSTFQTRPTSKNYIQFSQSPTGLKANLVEPSFQARMIELHKGHGPTWFRYYQIFAALCLIITVFNGLIMGLMSPMHRKLTMMTTAGGLVTFVLLAFIL